MRTLLQFHAFVDAQAGVRFGVLFHACAVAQECSQLASGAQAGYRAPHKQGTEHCTSRIQSTAQAGY